MSEEVHAAIVDSISDMEGAGDNGDVAMADAPEATAPAPPSDPAAAAAAPPQPDPTKAIIPETIEPELKLPGRLPLARHEKIVANLRAEHDAALKKLASDHEGKLKESLSPYQQQRELLDIADRDPERFLQALASADPRYRERLAPVLKAIETAQRSGNGGAPEPIGEMPGPDVTLSDGSTAYSQEGLTKLLNWNAQHVEQRLQQKYEPLLNEYQSRQATSAALQRVNTQLEKAMKLEGFNENQKAIAAAMRADRSLSLTDAYVQVVLPTFKPERDKIRQQVLAEINGGTSNKARIAASTAPSGGSARTAADAGDLSSVIRAAISHLPR